MTPTLTTQLAPCPFCGAAPRLFKRDEEKLREDNENFDVRCDTSGCYLEGGADRFLFKAEAVALWNRRSQAAAPEPAVQQAEPVAMAVGQAYPKVSLRIEPINGHIPEPGQNYYAEPQFSPPTAEAAQPVGLVPLTERQIVRCLVDAGCLGTVKMSYDSGPYEITRTTVNADRFARAIEAAHGILPAGNGGGA